jgi:hypothetical protein
MQAENRALINRTVFSKNTCIVDRKKRMESMFMQGFRNIIEILNRKSDFSRAVFDTHTTYRAG